MKKLSMHDLNRLSHEDFRDSPKVNVTVVLDDVRSMMNTGSVFRTGDAFRVRRICLCGITAKPPHREIEKTALGATTSVDWEYHENCRELLIRLRKEGAQIVAVEQLDDSIPLDAWVIEPDKPLALVFGNEVNGISEATLSVCDYGVEVPQFGTKHSLNIAVTAGIILWETFRQLRRQIS